MRRLMYEFVLEPCDGLVKELLFTVSWSSSLVGVGLNSTLPFMGGEKQQKLRGKNGEGKVSKKNLVGKSSTTLVECFFPSCPSCGPQNALGREILLASCKYSPWRRTLNLSSALSSLFPSFHREAFFCGA